LAGLGQEHRDGAQQLLGLALEAVGGGSAFLDQLGVLLRGLVRRRRSARGWSR
jgi:hypothetical protein